MNKLAVLDDNLKYKHIEIFENKVIYLGYDLGATKTERTILHALIENPKKPLSAEELVDLLPFEISKEGITFHICSINAKAKAIGERKIIKNIVKIGYFLNEEM